MYDEEREREKERKEEKKTIFLPFRTNE